MNEKQELHCHACQRYVQFDIDLSLNGDHVLECPNCGHEHCRVVKDGVITGDRWDSRNGGLAIWTVSTASITSTAVSTWDTYRQTATISTTTSATSTDVYLTDVYLYDAWMNTVK